MNIFWPVERVDDVFGAAYPPENAVEVCLEANRLIEEYIRENPDADERELADYSHELWESVCLYDKIGNVKVIWKEE